MKILKLAVAAALAVSGLTISAAPAAADQRGERWEQRDRDNARDDRRDDRRDSYRGHRGRYGANSSYNRGRHYGWNRGGRHRVCRTIWRHGHRQRVCRYRRWR